jgi:hypothetical protein
MNQTEIVSKLSHVKGNIHTFLRRFMKNEDDAVVEKVQEEDNYPSEVDDLPLTLTKEPRPGITFYSTENSPLVRGSTKADAEGIDSFGEKDTFDLDEVDDYQTNRDRNQNSDLSKRFYTGGLDLDDINRPKPT